MVRVRYTALAKLFALVVFAFFILPSLFRIFNNQATGPLDETGNEFGPVHSNNDALKRNLDDNNKPSAPDEVNQLI